MRNRKILLGFVVIVLLYFGTWIDAYFLLNENLYEHAQASYLKAEERNQEEVKYAGLTGTEPFIIPLHKDGPIARERCIPLLPGVVLRHWESSIGPMGGGGGSDLFFCYGFGSTKLHGFGGWRN